MCLGPLAVSFMPVQVFAHLFDVPGHFIRQVVHPAAFEVFDGLLQVLDPLGHLMALGLLFVVVPATRTATRVLWERSVGGPTGTAFENTVAGLRLDRVRRRGKYVVIDTSRDGGDAGALVVHLRMTGRLHVDVPSDDAGKFLRVALSLDDGSELRFIDVRKFGRFVHVEDPTAIL